MVVVKPNFPSPKVSFDIHRITSIKVATKSSSVEEELQRRFLKIQGHLTYKGIPSKNKGYFQSFTGLVKAPPFSESWVCADKWEHLLSLEHFSAASSSMDAFFHCHTVCVHFGAVAKDTLRNRNSFFFTPIRTIKWHCYFKPVLRSTLEKQCC